MKPAAAAFKRGRASRWTRERLEELNRHDLLNLRANAERLGESELAALCVELLAERPSTGPRSRAFAARGVYLADPRSSWSGVRKSDGMVVIALWQAAVESHDGACTCLLWAPNRDGARPWSDTAAGVERLEHCRLALEGGAEALLVHGEAIEGRLPEDRARTVLGVDAETVVRIQVEKRGDEYWATWGRRDTPGQGAIGAAT